jgi:hypothetical protein
MPITEKVAHEIIEELFELETNLKKWRLHGIGIIMSKHTFEVLKAVKHPKKDFVLQGVLVERRGKLRF